MLKTEICNLFGIQYPIIQGGMAYLATAELASAVSNAGGLGIIAAANYEAGWLREQIQLIRQLTEGPFGVNIYLPSKFIEAQIKVVVEEKVPVVATGSGDPGVYLSQFKRAGIKVMPVVASVSQAQKLESRGADVVVAEGMEAGGHIGECATLPLVRQVADSLHVPVIAAGGVGDGWGMAAAMALGAKGVQMGTRFICSEECIAHPDFKTRILKSNDRETVVIGRSIGRPVRCLANKFTEEYLTLEKAGAASDELGKMSRGRFYSGVREGNLDDGLLMAGQICGLIKDIKPVAVIIEDTIRQAYKVITGLYD